MRAVVFTLVILLFLTLSPRVVQAQAQPSAAVVAVAAEQVDWQETEDGAASAIELTNHFSYYVQIGSPERRTAGEKKWQTVRHTR